MAQQRSRSPPAEQGHGEEMSRSGIISSMSATPSWTIYWDCQHDIQSLRAKRARVADPLDRALWPMDEESWIASVSSRIKANADFLRLLPAPEVCCAPIEPPERALSIPPGHRVESRNSSKVRSTLRQFVRDWAVEGAPEREMCYGPLIEALQRHLPTGARGSQRVLCPGSGLGRLPFDLARVGYAAQGNEFSYHMIMGSQLVFNRTSKALCFTIYPFVTSIANRRRAADTLQAVRIPDLCPVDALPEGSDFSIRRRARGGEREKAFSKGGETSQKPSGLLRSFLRLWGRP
ncbi:unnamed protein product, partial [Prorocentrum cordatum]